MILEISKSVLQEKLNIINPILPVRSTKPIAECILMELKGNELSIVATDLSLTYVSTIEVNGKEDGIIIVPGKKFSTIIKGLPEGNITLEKKDSMLNIKINSIKFEIAVTENSDEFPAIPEKLENNKMVIDSLKLKKFIGKTTYAASDDELRAVLTGVLLSVSNDKFTIVATDSVRLVKLIDNHLNFEGSEIDVIIPSRSLNLIQNSIIRNDDCNLFLGENYIEVRFENTTIFSRLINGKYPAYQSIIPVNNDISVSIDKNKLINAVNRISITCNPLTKRLNFSFENNKLTISAEDSNTASKSEESLDIEYGYDDFAIGFNSNKILDILKNIDSESIVMLMSTPGKPIIIKPSEDNNLYDIIALLMPVQVKTAKKK
ncbi:MAG: DNA polymerase III subunit beta [Candidatus Cloacimonadota bacterium]|nr:MAG: DNA polymerase III subunit beta [Candidatus Cloacimonadota bacterium]PIE79214.1 MAG: DNA polymerase III subunit beta [Candidatus Delongbacteria bacterium]